MIRENLQYFIKNVEGRTVFIVGGGPSITKETIDYLNQSNKPVFCLNSAVSFIDNPVGVMWCDDSWATNRLDYLTKLECSKFYVKQHGATHIAKSINGVANSIILNKSGDFGFDPDINSVRGNNSGAYSINFLVNCKVKTIALIGFDMNVLRNGVAHFHKEYTYSIRPAVYSELFVPSIESMATIIENSGYNTKIINCNKSSKLRCFDFADMKDIK